MSNTSKDEEVSEFSNAQMLDSALFWSSSDLLSAIKNSKTSDHKFITPIKSNGSPLLAFSGSEEISELYSFKVIFAMENPQVDFSKILKQRVSIELTTQKNTQNSSKKYLSGIVKRIGQGNTFKTNDIFATVYEAEVVPNLYLLTLNKNYTFYQNKTPIEIIKNILENNGITNVEYGVTDRGKRKRESCIQYDESDYDFFKRILSEEGMFFFFEFEKGKDKLIITENNNKFITSGKKLSPPIAFDKKGIDKNTNFSVNSCLMQELLVGAKYCVNDYDYNKPGSPISASAKGSTKVDFGNYFDFCENIQDTNALKAVASVRADAMAHESKFVYIRTMSWLNHGNSFEIVFHNRKDFNQEYVVDKITHEFLSVANVNYHNTIRAFNKQTSKYRPSHIVPRKRITGYLSAVVTGKDGQEVFRDDLARIKIRFLWDSDGKKNKENSSGWVRVVQSYAGIKFGTMFVPRVGNEVIVIFMEGNPDRPLVIGSVYNGINKPPYKDSDISCIKTKSFGKNEGFNEIKFIDKEKDEKFYMHAQKNFEMLVKENSQIMLEKGNSSITLQKGNYTLILQKGNITVDVKGGIKVKATEDIEFSSDKSIKLTARQDIALNASKKFSVQSTGNATIETKAAAKITSVGGMTLDAKGPVSVKSIQGITLDAKMAINIKTIMTMTLDAKMAINIKTTMAMTLDAKMAINIKAIAAITLKSQISTNVEGTLLNAKGMAIASLGAAIIKIG